MTTGHVEVDSTLSYAHRSGDEIQVVLRLPAFTTPDSAPEVRLRSRRQTVVVRAEAGHEGQDTVLRLAVPAQGLRDRVWRLALLRSGTGTAVPVQARLLTAADRPVALLPGPPPATRMAPPRPAGSNTENPAVRAARRLPRPVQHLLRRGRAAVAARRG